MAQREDVPGWVKMTLEDLKYSLVKDGFGYEELKKMRIYEIYILAFSRYKQNYVEWYRHEKWKEKSKGNSWN